MTQRTVDDEKAALKELLDSEGWAIFQQMVQHQFGPEAFERKVDEVMTELRPGDDERAVVTQIRATFKAVRALVELPKERLRQIESGDKPSGIRDRFAHLRGRVPA